MQFVKRWIKNLVVGSTISIIILYVARFCFVCSNVLNLGETIVMHVVYRENILKYREMLLLPYRPPQNHRRT